jgi:hypothetical protein
VDEDVSASVLGLNEAEALLGVKPFNCAVDHDVLCISPLSGRVRLLPNPTRQLHNHW